MSNRLITLTTDFGEGSPYAAVLKGVVLSVNPQARLLDLSHRIPPQDIASASWFLARTLPWFPEDAIHVIVVDPGVGTNRALLLIRAGTQWLLAPDNGCWTAAAARLCQHLEIWRLSRRKFWLPRVSKTFHGRDILAPVAAHLSLGVEPEQLGQATETYQSHAPPVPLLRPRRLVGEVVALDSFGNAITNLPASAVLQPAFRKPAIRLGLRAVGRLVKTYGEAAPGDVVALLGSDDLLEIAVVNGSAARELDLAVGDRVEVTPA